jgi:hypothetical protein
MREAVESIHLFGVFQQTNERMGIAGAFSLE